MPGEPEALTHQQLLRSMDALMDHQAAVDDCIAGLLRPLIDDELSVVFYDLTTIRAEGLSQQDADVRHFGMSKEGVIARQFMLGVGAWVKSLIPSKSNNYTPELVDRRRSVTAASPPSINR